MTGNVIIVFGFLISLAVFLNYGWDRNMFGGYEFNIEGAAGAALLLFLNILLGVLFKKAPARAYRSRPLQKQDRPNSDLSARPHNSTQMSVNQE